MCAHTNQNLRISQNFVYTIYNLYDIKHVDEFKYLGSYIGRTQHDVSVIIGSAWARLNSLNIIWKYKLSSKRKRNLFRATFVTVLV